MLTHPKTPTVLLGDLHLWTSTLNLNQTQIDQLKTCLSPDELARSEKFKLHRAQEHFIAARGILREILGLYLKQPPNEIQFTYERHGKPKLRDTLEADNLLLSFNLSHSHGRVVYGICKGQRIGIDLEYKERKLNFDDLAHRWFSEPETKEIMNAQHNEKAIVFYNIWTKKEALLKALGSGLHTPLNEFTVTGSSSNIDTLSHLHFDPHQEQWTIFSLEHHPLFSLSIAMNQKPAKINYWRYQVN